MLFREFSRFSFAQKSSSSSSHVKKEGTKREEENFVTENNVSLKFHIIIAMLKIAISLHHRALTNLQLF